MPSYPAGIHHACNEVTVRQVQRSCSPYLTAAGVLVMYVSDFYTSSVAYAPQYRSKSAHYLCAS